MKGISIIVCCYNSSNRLPKTIEHIAQQKITIDFRWEVIIVNNASTDKTEEIALREIKKYHNLKDRFKIVNQMLPGLTYARQKGVDEALYNYIIFCDDDNWLDQNYLANAYCIMEDNKQIGALGGMSICTTDATTLPNWFESVKSWYAVGAQAPSSGNVSHTCNIWGAGMVTRKDLYAYCYSKEYPALLTDRNGTILSSGGDTEYCLRLLLKEYKLYYDERLKFTHFIPQERLQIDYKNRLRTDGLQSSKEMRKYWQLYNFLNTRPIFKPMVLVKTFFGFLSAKLLGRKSWALDDVKRIFFYATLIDLGVDSNTKLIHDFYKNHNWPST